MSAQQEAVTPSEMVQGDVTSFGHLRTRSQCVILESYLNTWQTSLQCLLAPTVHKTLPVRGTGRNPNEVGVSHSAKVIHPTWRQFGNRARQGRPTEVPRSGHA